MPTEEQTQYEASMKQSADDYYYLGQKLTIPNRKVTKLGFWLGRQLAPSGNVTLQIRRVSDDGLICEKVWGTCISLSTSAVYREVTFDSPQTIDEEVRIVSYVPGGNSTNYVRIWVQLSSVKAGEVCTWRENGSFVDFAARECAYIYTYQEPAVGLENKSAGMAAKMIAGRAI